MGKTETYKKALEWEKDNVTRVSLKFMNSTDADIVNYLKGKPKQETIKRALRLLMEHESGGEK